MISFIAGPESFASFDEILDRTVTFNPTRSVSSLRRGILHNARSGPTAPGCGATTGSTSRDRDDPRVRPLLGRRGLRRVHVPFMLVRGADSPVVGDEDVEELRRRRPAVRVEVVEGAGHSIQGDQPLELARLIDEHAHSVTS